MSDKFSQGVFMYYCGELKNLSVLSLYEGELIGKVDKLFFDKKLKKLIELEIVGENDLRYILPTKNIYHIGKNAITIKNNQAVNLKVENSQYFQSPIGNKTYSIKGEFLGVVKEISLNEKYLTEKFSLDNETSLSVKNVASCGKNAVIFYEINDRVAVSKFTPKPSPKMFKQDAVQTASILPIETEIPKMSAQPSLTEVQAQNLQNGDFLLGRICLKDIFNFNNEVLIKAHAIVTKKNLKEIKKYNKLRELMLFCK